MKEITPRMIKLLQRFEYPTDVSFEKASEIIGALRVNNWQRPDDKKVGKLKRVSARKPASNAGPATPFEKQVYKSLATVQRQFTQVGIMNDQAGQALDDLEEIAKNYVTAD